MKVQIARQRWLSNKTSQKLAHRKQICLQLGHVKNNLDTNSFDFTFHHHFNNNRTNSNHFHDAIITQIDIAWSKYLICVKCHSTGSHVVWCSQIHNKLIHRLWMHYMLCCKCVIIIIFGIVNIIFIYFLPRSKNMQCGLVCHNSSMFWCFALRWIACFALTYHNYDIITLGFLLLHLGHLVHQTYRYLLHSQLFHLQGGDHVFVRRWQVLEQHLRFLWVLSNK